jgi:uncharacterized protein (DUF433 family)
MHFARSLTKLLIYKNMHRLAENNLLFARITVNPSIMIGKPTIRGTPARA